MAEMANTLAFSAYNQEAILERSSLTAAPTQEYALKYDLNSRDRDSGIFLSDSENTLPSTPSRQSSISHKQSLSRRPTLTRTESTRVDRLRRPAELNLSSTGTPDDAKPKSELEMHYEMVRNSQTRSKTALKSPTQLLNDRLNLSPKKKTHEITRIFTPPRPMLNGCILPGPAAQMDAFTRKDVCARTEKGKPSWWCKVDKVVIFDGVEDNDGDVRFQTRSSKGLSIARRRGDSEIIVIPLNCDHCQEMLNRSEWKYDIQVCKRSVCWDCKERCRWQSQQTNKGNHSDTGRERADSVLQDQQVQDEILMRKVGIEMGPQSPIEAVGGIEERMKDKEK